MAKSKVKRTYQKIVEEAPSYDVVSSSISPLYPKSYLRPYNPDSLYQKKNWDVFDQMRQDDQVSCLLRLKKYLVLSAGWEFSTEDEKIKEFFKNMFSSAEGQLGKWIYDILSAFDYGFSATEKIWAKNELGIVLTDLKTRAPHGFELHTDDAGNMSKLVQNTDKGYVDLDPAKIILFSYQKEFDNFYGQSDLNEGVYRSWWSKNAIIKFWNIYLERFGMPIAWGKYKQGNAKMIQNIRAVLDNLQSKTSIVTPDDVVIELLEATRAGTGGYETAIDRHNLFIARAMLIPDLLGFGGAQTGGGSFALGEKQFEIFYSIISTLRADIAMTLNRHIVWPLVQWNFGSSARADFRFLEIDKKKQESDLKMWLEFQKSAPTEDIKQINWFLKSIGAPEFDEAQMEADKARRDEMAIQIAQGKGAEAVAPKNPKKEEDENASETGNAEGKEYSLSRPLTIYEKKEDISAVSKKMDSLVDKYALTMYDKLAEIVNAMAKSVRDRSIIERQDYNAVGNLTLKNTRDLDRIVRSMLADAYNVGINSTRGKADKIKGYMIDSQTAYDDVDAKLREWIDVTAQTVVSWETNNILQRSKSILSESIRTGVSVDDTIKLLDQALKAYDMTVDGNRLEMIVRTETHRAYNEARAQQFDSVKDNITAYQYSAVMDDRTSDICTALDQKIIKPSELSFYNPPNHPNCRSELVPIFADEPFEKEQFETDAPPATIREPGGFLKLAKG